MHIAYKSILVAIALAVSSLVLPPFALTLLTEVCILGLFAMSLDLMVGYARLVSFGHAAAYGLGAYACALLSLHTTIPLPAIIIISALFAGVIAIGIGWVCTVATGVSFSMLTLAFGQLFYAIVFKWTSVTNGTDGLVGIPRTPGPFGWSALTTRTGFYLFCGGCLLGAFLLCRAIIRSPFGNVLQGIRENEAKTRSLGFNTRRYKIMVIAISYMFGGMAGALYVAFAGFASPDLVYWFISGQVLIMVILGGSGTLLGPIVGAAFYMLVEYQLGTYMDSWALVLGTVFILSVLFMPRGIWGLFKRRVKVGAAAASGGLVNEDQH